MGERLYKVALQFHETYFFFIEKIEDFFREIALANQSITISKVHTRYPTRDGWINEFIKRK